MIGTIETFGGGRRKAHSAHNDRERGRARKEKREKQAMYVGTSADPRKFWLVVIGRDRERGQGNRGVWGGGTVTDAAQELNCSPSPIAGICFFFCCFALRIACRQKKYR